MAVGPITNGRLVERLLRAVGVDAVYGAPLAGVEVVPVASAPVAALLAEAHGRVHGRPAAVHEGHGTLVVAGGGARPLTVGSADDLVGAVVPLSAAARGGGGLTLAVGLDPEAPAPDVVPPVPPPADRWIEPGDEVVAALSAATRPVMLVGPGLVRGGAVPGLHAVAAAASLGVLNTWGAKGVFDWRSRHHLATAGLQEHDFTLAGLGDADLIVAAGVDPAEAADGRWRLAPVVDVPPGALDPLSGRWSRPPASIPLPPLRAELARVTQEGWASTAVPLAPSLVTRHYSEVFGAGGLVAADPGVAGYWVARTFATTELGGAQVPAAGGSDGFAVACATVARLRTPRRPVLAAVDGPLSDRVGDALEAAGALGVSVPVEVWHPGGPALAAGRHLARLQALVHADAPSPVDLATDVTQVERMIQVAGPVVAWRS